MHQIVSHQNQNSRKPQDRFEKQKFNSQSQSIKQEVGIKLHGLNLATEGLSSEMICIHLALPLCAVTTRLCRRKSCRWKSSTWSPPFLAPIFRLLPRGKPSSTCVRYGRVFRAAWQSQTAFCCEQFPKLFSTCRKCSKTHLSQEEEESFVGNENWN